MYPKEHARARHRTALPRSQEAQAPHNGHGAPKVLGQELLQQAHVGSVGGTGEELRRGGAAAPAP